MKTKKNNNLEKLIRIIVKETLDIMGENLQKGEWWIYPGGQVEFADVNIGDSGHEGYVIQYIVREILEHFDIQEDNPEYLTEYEDQIIKYLEDEGKNINGSFFDIVLREILEDGLYTNQNQAKMAVSIAMGSTNIDARNYAMEYLRWKRLDIRYEGVYVQTWDLTPGDLRDISNGIYDAGGEEELGKERQTVNIEVRRNNNIYKNIPFEVLNRDNIMALQPYNVTRAWITEGIFHEHKEWIMYEGDNKIITVFKDNSRLAFEVKYPGGTWGKDRDKWKHKAASKWKSLAREIYSSNGLSEVGNPIIKPWKVCYQEALNRPEMKEFIRKNFNPIF